MKLVVGLGNIGPQYHTTRHNLGFNVVTMLGISMGYGPEKFNKHTKAPANVLDVKADLGALLVQPTTMMNLSGEAVQALAAFYRIPSEDIWVVYDDVDLEFGQMRVRFGGGSAGHNGVKSIIQHLGENFWRIRLGISNQYLANTPTEKFVLDSFMANEAEKLPAVLNGASNYIEASLTNNQIADHTQSLLVE